MSHLLPPQGHAARDMFDVAHLVDVATGKLPVRDSIPRLRAHALATMAETAVKRVVCFHADAATDALRLVSFGPRGGMRVEWVFGPITSQTRLAH